jgi:uncharacterized protein (TIGR02757 family)
MTLELFLSGLVDRFESPHYIRFDPIAIPHGFDDPRDQEVIGLYAAILAWGRRETILTKMEELCGRMQFRPYRFVRDFRIDRHADALRGFKHRTFNEGDAIWLTSNLGTVLKDCETIEKAFARWLAPGATTTEAAIEGFSRTIMAAGVGTPPRLSKHLARPSTGSACKRLNMYLRWMVRPGPFDLGIWRSIDKRSLVLPLDIHSGTHARRLGLLTRAANDWKAAKELTEACRRLDPDDPCRFDLALFGIGAYDVTVPSELLPPEAPPESSETYLRS